MDGLFVDDSVLGFVKQMILSIAKEMPLHKELVQLAEKGARRPCSRHAGRNVPYRIGCSNCLNDEGLETGAQGGGTALLESLPSSPLTLSFHL